MDNNDVQLVGGPCGQHGAYTFYKAFKYTKNGIKRLVTLSEFFFVKMWRDSDLLCIGELQLLWVDKNSDQVLASLRLYFLPENTPEGRMDHGEDEVLAISEKVVIRVEDLITWITAEAEWTWGRLAKCEKELQDDYDDIEETIVTTPRKANATSFIMAEIGLDFSDVENERKDLEPLSTSVPQVIILSFPAYCRYRAMAKRLEGMEHLLKHRLVNALGGFYVKHPNTRVLFCKDTFDYPELEGHELLCNHLAPKLKGRPRGRRKKRSVSPGSESNESESSVANSYNTRADNKNGLRCNSNIVPRRSTRCHENNENKEFVRRLAAFMKSNHTPIGRIPSLGYKELNLHEFFTKVQKLGGYDCVTTNRLWKSIFDDMSGHQSSTSAATIIRRHYERFLLPYERHVKGEEYKPLPVSERRRLKSKRGSDSISDADSSGGDVTPTPSTSRKNSIGNIPEVKDNVKPEGKPSSLRSIRVKPERQKDKKIISDKDSVPNNNNNNNNNDDVSSAVQQQSSIKSEIVNNSQENKFKVEKLIIKTDSMTVKTDCTNTDSPLVKIEYATVKSEPGPIKSEFTIDDNDKEPIKAEIIPINIENSLKIEPTLIKTEVIRTEETTSVKVETAPITTEVNIEVKIESFVKSESINIPDKNVEPVTSAATPVAQKLPVDQQMSPVEGKENIPLIKTADTATKNSPDIIEVPYTQKLPQRIDLESETFRNTFIHEVKKRKLDILKEGGLEVTPVRPTLMNPPMKDVRPSVIHQATPPAQVIPKPIRVEIMPPPMSSVHSKRPHISVPQTLNISQVKVTPMTPVKKSVPCTNSFSFVNGATPPKVVQSKSIYTYSEKTVYGNPKDILPSPLKPAVPKFIGTAPRLNGGDPVDLSVNSPQKPVVEIMRVPQISSPYNRDTVTKNLYKMNASPIMDGRRLGSNLEITVVGPNKHQSSHIVQKPNYGYFPPPSNHYHPQKRMSSEYYTPSKIPKNEENGRYKTPNIPYPKHNVDINIPHPYKTTNMKPEAVNSHMKPPLPQTTPTMKPYANPGLPTFPPYLSQLYEQTAKGLPPYMPLIDHAMYYSAAMQSLYSSGALNSAPILPIPTPEQLKLYTELMAHGRLNFPFTMPQDGSSSVSNNFKKP